MPEVDATTSATTKIMSGSILFAIALASLGAALVLAGLLLETFADKKWFKTIKSKRCWEAAKVWGEWLVIFGVLIELADGGYSAVYGWRIEPKNQPVKSLRVDVYMFVLGTNFKPQWCNLGTRSKKELGLRTIRAQSR